MSDPIDEDEPLDAQTEREPDVGPPVPAAPAQVDLLGVFRGLRRLFGSAHRGGNQTVP